MRTALLIADLEGVCGVDSLEALAFGGEGHPEACALMTSEVNAAIEGLLAQGFEQVRVSDSHRSGSGVPNLSPGQLHDAAELRFTDHDYYGGRLLDGIEAVACVGMHAAGGTKGFAAHTVAIHTAWLLDGRPISETELAYWLAADLGIPAIFSAGDDVLGAAASGLAAYLITKKSTAIDVSKSKRGVLPKIRDAAAQTARALKKAPQGVLSVRFKNQRQADAAQTTGATRSSPWECAVSGSSFTERYFAALEAVVASEPVVAEEVDGFPGTRRFAACGARLLMQPFPGAHRRTRKKKSV